MKFSNNSLQHIPDQARLSTSSSRYSKIYIKSIPTSPLRALTPLGFVSASNVKITQEMQKNLLKHSFQRKSLARTLQKSNEVVDKNVKGGEKSQLDQHNRIETSKELNLKECTFGKSIGNKENSYADIHSRHKKASVKRLKCDLNSIESAKKNLNEKLHLKLCLDTNELETRYLKISNNLERLSRNIQCVIKNSNYN